MIAERPLVWNLRVGSKIWKEILKLQMNSSLRSKEKILILELNHFNVELKSFDCKHFHVSTFQGIRFLSTLVLTSACVIVETDMHKKGQPLMTVFTIQLCQCARQFFPKTFRSY